MYRIYLATLLLIIFSACNKTEDIDNNILRLYGDALEDIGYSITRADDGYVIAGQLTEVARIVTNIIDTKNSEVKMGLIKTSLNGDVIWQKSFGDKLPAVGKKAIVLTDGSVVCAGYIIDTATQLKDIFIVKTNSSGDALVQKIYKEPGDESNQYATDIIKTPEGYLVLGTTDAANAPVTDSTGNEAGKKDILVLILNNNLDLLGKSTKGFPGNDEGVAIKEDIAGGYIIAATTDLFVKYNEPSGKNILILKVNTKGDFVQYRIMGKAVDEYASDIEVQSDGYLIAGTVGADGQDQYGYIWKMSQNIFAPPITEGKIEIKSSTPVSFKINAVSRYKTSSYVMAGQWGKGSSARMLIFLTDDEGNLLPEKVVYNGGTGSQSVNDVISDDGGNIYAVGKNSYETNSMISLLKFRF